MLKRTLVSIGAVAALSTLAACGSDTSSVSDPTGTTSSDSSSSSSPQNSSGSAPTSSGAPSSVSCTYTKDGSSAGKDVDLPPSTPTVTGDVPATISTGVGTLDATLDAANAPCTVNSFVSLADQGFFDDTPCHRLTTTGAGIFVLQCGDPSGTGTGGPGYSFADELKGTETYGPGTLAMANGGPDTNGSQFFVVYGSSPLPASYTVFGKIDAASVAVVQKVASAGTNNAFGADDGAPNTKVQITSVKVG